MDKFFDKIEDHPLVSLVLVIVANLVLLGLSVVVIVGTLRILGVM